MARFAREVADAGLIAGACKYCSEAFGVAADVQKSSVEFVDQDHGHPSVAKLVEEGNTILTL